MNTRFVMRMLLAAFYLSAGTLHLVATDAFLPIVPDWVPLPRETVLLTGLCEIAGSIALMTRRLRRLAGIMLALYAVCVFPANIKHAVEGIHVPPLPDSWWYHAPRLLLQPVLIWWRCFAPASSTGHSKKGGTEKQVSSLAVLSEFACRYPQHPPERPRQLRGTGQSDLCCDDA